MTRKLIGFDPETLRALELLSRDSGKSLQQLADEAFADLLAKHHRPHFYGSVEEKHKLMLKVANFIPLLGGVTRSAKIASPEVLFSCVAVESPHAQLPLLGVQRTWRGVVGMSANDP
jgi:hypothetical protein